MTMPEPLIIHGVTLIDGTGGPPIEHARIVIEAGRISSVDQDSSAAGAASIEGGQAIDGRGLWATPGLIDTHIHLQLVGRPALPLLLALGITTIRDLGGPLDFLAETRRQLEDGAVGPRLLFTGPMIDGEPPTWPALVHPAPDAEAAAQAAREHLNAGADAIKLYTTLPPESLRRCIDEVAGRVPVTGHLGRTSAAEAMQAGINGLEHALLTPYNDLAPADQRTSPDEVMATPGFWQKVYAGWLQTDLTADHVKRWIDLLVERDVSFCPTLTVVPGADEPIEEEFDTIPSLRRLQAEREEQRRSQGRQPPQRHAATSELRARLAGVRAKLQELTGLVHQAGGRVVAGTDSGAIGNLVPGFSLHRELGYLSGADLSNMEALRAATSRAAEALWRDDFGVIAPGKRADLLLLRRDPLADLGALRDIERVIRDGRPYDPALLLAQAATEHTGQDG